MTCSPRIGSMPPLPRIDGIVRLPAPHSSWVRPSNVSSRASVTASFCATGTLASQRMIEASSPMPMAGASSRTAMPIAAHSGQPRVAHSQ